MTKVTKRFLVSNPEITDDSFISTAVLKAGKTLQAGFCLYNGEQSLVLKWPIPMVELEGIQSNQLTAFRESVTNMITALQELEMTAVTAIAEAMKES